ncbi:MAG TPA: DUF2244 domain-containing protein [Steroidobacteraceae bacterium]|nr:DUF2244 domain-containing protein [Steroidobacteraceae bacterium]
MDTTSDELCLELRPNCALTRASALLFFGFVCLTSFGIATLMAVQGFWPVLPFAGLEMLVLGWALRVSLANAHVVQRLAVTQDTVRVDCSSPRSEEHLVFPRHWSKVTLRASYTALHPSQLLIESRGRAVEIGGFLTEDERRGLAARLKQMIGTINESPPLDGRTAAQAP